MDIHTDISPVLSLSSPLITIASQVMPLPWKLTHTDAQQLTLQCDRKIGNHSVQWTAGQEGNHSENWKLSALVIGQEVRLSLVVNTHRMDPYVVGETQGWTAIITATPSRSVSLLQLQTAVTDDGAAHAVTAVLNELVLIMQERRMFFGSVVSHD
jgi:hypothetical protein